LACNHVKRRAWMRLASVETLLVRHALSRGTGPAGAYNHQRQTVVIKLTTTDGIVGWGETYAVAGVRDAIETTLKPLLLQHDDIVSGRLHQQMRDATFGNGFAVGGLDIALHDLRGKTLGVPIHALYGGAHRASVRAYASGLCYREGLDPSETWLAEACALVERGFSAIKMRIGGYPPEHELPLIQRVKEALPRGTQLFVDAWGAYSPATAIAVGRELQRLGIGWFEEPLPQAGYAGYEHVAAALDMPVAGGEMLQSRAAFKELFDRRGVDIVQPDICICGGIGEARFVADLAALYGVVCVPHTWNGAIMHVASLHLAAVLSSSTRVPDPVAGLLEYDTTENELIRRLVQPEWQPVDGCFVVPTGPGLGVEIDEEWIRAHAD
jgi:D-galactarolactone cycloisomerase